MKKFTLVILFILIMSNFAFAFQPAVIGGVRNNGAAIGLMAEHGRFFNANLRFGAEATSGTNPVLIFYGGKFLLGNLAKGVPVSLALSILGNFGNTFHAGFGIALNIDRIFGYKPLFAELGVDLLEAPKLQAQLGLKF